MMNIARNLFVGFLLSFMVGCGIGKRPANFEPEKVEATGSYIHRGSKMVFPDKFENLIRTGITKFDEKEEDIGVGYSGNNIPLEITVFVYPAPKLVSIASPKDVIEHARDVLFQNHYEGLKGDVKRGNSSAVLLSDEDYELDQGKESYKGKVAKYKLNYRYSLGEKPSNSSLYLFQIGKWLVSYRITYLNTFAAEFDPMIQNLMKGLKLPQNEI